MYLFQNEGKTVLFRQGVNRQLEPVRLFLFVQGPLGTMSSIWKGEWALLGLKQIQHVHEEEPTFSVPPPQFVNRQIRRDPVQPGREPVFPLIAMGISKDPDERILTEINGPVIVTDDAVYVVDQSVLVPVNQYLECVITSRKITGD